MHILSFIDNSMHSANKKGFLFLDVGKVQLEPTSNQADMISIKSLKMADIVVIGLIQEKDLIMRFF